MNSLIRFSRNSWRPLLFGLIAGLFIPGGGAVKEGAEVAPEQTLGLQVAFLVTLIPLAGAGVVLLLTRRHYPIDVASAGESERRGKATAAPSEAKVLPAGTGAPSA